MSSHLGGPPGPAARRLLSGEVLGGAARLVVRQRYWNEERRPIEAIYTFPLPGEASIAGFAMECRPQARGGGQGARRGVPGLRRGDRYRPRRGAARRGAAQRVHGERRQPPSWEETVVEVASVQALTADEGALRLVIPTSSRPATCRGVTAGRPDRARRPGAHGRRARRRPPSPRSPGSTTGSPWISSSISGATSRSRAPRTRSRCAAKRGIASGSRSGTTRPRSIGTSCCSRRARRAFRQVLCATGPLARRGPSPSPWCRTSSTRMHTRSGRRPGATSCSSSTCRGPCRASRSTGRSARRRPGPPPPRRGGSGSG